MKHDDIAALLQGLSPAYAPTPLMSLPDLADELDLAGVLLKNEAERTLGSFKSLGGTYAGLRALARAVGTDVRSLLRERPSLTGVPPLITASAGNHGLAVAAAAAYAGHRARIYLYSDVAPARAARIAALGAEIAEIDGTYDDAVAQADADATAGRGLLVADVSAIPGDPMIDDIMAGYGVMADEIRGQTEMMGQPRPTHLFVQAGVGGLAAALATGLHDWLAPPARIIIVEPEQAACVGDALATGRRRRIEGALATSAGMLACGEISAPAFEILRRHGASAMTADEARLRSAVDGIRRAAGIETTPSGAAGFAGLSALAATSELRRAFALDSQACVLFLVTERQLDGGVD